MEPSATSRYGKDSDPRSPGTRRTGKDPCGICGSPYLSEFLNLGDQPVAERYGKDSPVYPLRLVRCQSCTLVQLDGPPDPSVLFPRDHPYATGNSGALRAHYAKLAVAAGWHLSPGDLVVDIGANDGTLLFMFADGVRKVAVEPTDQSFKIDGATRIYQEFFSLGLATRIRDEHGPAKLVTACNVLAHVPYPHDFMAGVVRMLAEDGEFVTENHDLRSVVDGLQIDTVYHEHLRYYDIVSLGRLLSMHGLAITDVLSVPTHGGSFRVTARRVGYGNLQARAVAAARDLHAMCEDLAAGGNRIYGVGASTRATPLMHYAGIARFLDCVCEVETSDKIGLTMPGTAIPIVPDAKLIADQPPYALLFSWHMADMVIPKLRAAGYDGKFIIPLPEPEIR